MITLTPAYGRDYTSKRQVLMAWSAGCDFIINEFGNMYDGKPCNIQDMQGETVKFRFARQSKVFVLTI